MSAGGSASNLSGISDDEYLSSQLVEDRLDNLRNRVWKSTSVEELREVCSSFESQLMQCIHDINDLKSTEVELRGQVRKFVKAEEEHQARIKSLYDELAQSKSKHQNALELIDYLEHQLAKTTDATQQQHPPTWRSSVELDGEPTDDDSESSEPETHQTLRNRLSQTIRDNTQLHSHINDLEAQLIKARQRPDNSRPDNSRPDNSRPDNSRQPTYDLKALRQELEDCIKQGLTPQLNVHIHHHEDHHIHNHEHQHYYGYKNLSTPRGVPATISVENMAASMSVSVTAPLARGEMTNRSFPIKN